MLLDRVLSALLVMSIDSMDYTMNVQRNQLLKTQTMSLGNPVGC